MPIPRYTPGTGNLGAAQPILDGPGQAYNNVVDFANHPMDSLKGMLGMGHQPPPQQGPSMVDEANQTFIKPTPNPVVAPPRRKPMVNTGGF
jgi:hypothetical protein